MAKLTAAEKEQRQKDTQALLNQMVSIGEQVKKDASAIGNPSKEVINGEIRVNNRSTPEIQKLNLQQKKEERLEVKSPVNAAQIKRDRTKKDYDDYVKSDEYKQRVTANDQRARADAAAQLFLNPGQPMPQPKVIQDEKEMQLRAAMEQAEKEYNDAEDQKVIEQDLEAITGLSAEERRQLEQYAVGRDVDYYESMNMAQNGFQMGRAQQNASDLIAKYGQKRVDEMANSISRQNNAQLTQQIAELGQKHGDEHGFISSVGSVAANTLGGIMGTMDYIKELGRNDQRFKTLDPNAIGNVGNVYSGAVRGQVQQNIEGENPNFLRKTASLGYQGVMSAADSIARAYLGGGAFGGAALAATNSFSQTMAEASRKGASPAQAALLATTTAGIEALSEKIPLDNLIRTAKGQGFKSVILNALAQAGIEATTEEISLLGTVLAEAAILQEKSSYRRDVMTAIMNGVSVDDAIEQASRNIIDEAVNTALVSMISGGASSLGGSYADARGMFAETQEQTNPELNRPKNAQEATQEAIANNQARRERLAAEETAQQPQTAQTQEPEQTPTQPQQQETPAQQPAQPKQSVSDTVAEVLTNLRETNGKATNKMAETVMSDPAAMQELGITPEGTKAEQRRRVKEEMEKLFQNQNQTTETSTPAADTQVQSTQERQPTNRPQNVDSIDNNAAESSTNVDSKASQPAEMSTNVDEMSRNVERSAENTAQQGNKEMQRDRINSVREQHIPVTDPDGRVVSEAAGNIYTSSRTPDSFAPTIRRLVDEGRVSHDVQTNEESLNKAAASIAKDGSIQNALNSIKEVAKSGRTGAIDVAKGVLIYDELVKSSDSTHQALAEECFVTLTELATNTGRPMQLFSLFRKMTPESQLRTMERVIQRNVERLQKSGTVKKDFRPTFNQELEQNYVEAARDAMNAKTDQARLEAEQSMQELQNAMSIDAAAQMPSTFKAKWDAWRYMAMLGNVKTQVRNVVGNLAFKPYKEVKDKMGALAEKLFVPKDQRTKSLITDQALAKWAREDAKTQNVNEALKYSAKLGDDVSAQKIRENMRVFDSKTLDSVRRLVESVPQSGDMLFKNNYYSRSLAGFLKARGYTVADIQNNLVNESVLNEARSYAVQEAMKATFNDSNAFSDFLATELRYKGENPMGKAFNMIAEGVLPFRRTPANIAVRFSEYSPVGVAKGLWDAATKVRKGEMTAATAIDQLASGLTGSAVMALGFVLAGGLNGIKITGSGTDEDEKRQGHQDYALEFSVDGQEYSYKIDWAAPANLPLFVGANIYSALENAGEDTDVSKFTSFIRGMGTAFEPMLALSCMSSLNDLVEGVRYAEEGEALYTMASQAATSYFTQGIPSLARQTTQAFTENKQTTFTTSDDPTIRDLQSTAAGLGVGNLYKTDKVNAWGEVESAGTPFERIVNSFLNPGTYKKIDNSDVEKEISRLNDAGQNVTPDHFSKTVSYIDKDGNGHDEVRLTEEQYQKMAQTQGQTARKLVEDMIKSDSYKAMTDEQKADAINTAYQYARMTGEIAAIEDHTGYDQSWMYDVEKLGAEEIIRRTINSGINTSTEDLKNAWDNGYNEERFVQEMETMFRSYQNAPPKMKKQVYEEATGTAKKYIEVRDKGISHANAIKAIKAVETVKGTGSVNKETGQKTVRDIDRRQAIARAGLDEKTTDILMKAYMADYDPNDESPETTEFKYQYAREELGLSPTEYAATYRAYLDNDRKAQKIAAIRAMGYDWKTANALYKLYYGRMKDDLIEMYG